MSMNKFALLSSMRSNPNHTTFEPPPERSHMTISLENLSTLSNQKLARHVWKPLKVPFLSLSAPGHKLRSNLPVLSIMRALLPRAFKNHFFQFQERAYDICCVLQKVLASPPPARFSSRKKALNTVPPTAWLKMQQR